MAADGRNFAQEVVRYADVQVGAPVLLSDDCSLRVPVDDPPRVGLPPMAAAPPMVRKVEHHITVFDSAIGQGLAAAIAEVPAVRGLVDGLVAAADFTWRVPAVPRLWRLHRPAPRELQTVVIMVDAPGIADLFAACAERLPAVGAAAIRWDPPPPHITVFTSDPGGAAGIGLHRWSDLDEAARRGDSGDTTGLRAFAVPMREVA